jgi:hypothetical protein
MTRTYALDGLVVCVDRNGTASALVRGPTDGSLEPYELPPIFPPSQVIGAESPFDHTIHLVIHAAKLVVIMVHAGGARHVYSYDPEPATWCYKGKTENGVSDSAVAVTSEGIALIGGSIDTETQIRWCEWNKNGADDSPRATLPELDVPLAGACAVALYDSVFIVGGHNESGPSSGVLVHTFGGKRFTHIGNLSEPRWDFAAVIVDSPNAAGGPHIYCFGGAGFRHSPSCEVFDVLKKTSRTLAHAPVEDKIHSAWYLGDGTIEVVAGNMLLAYSITFDSWTVLSRNVPACAKAVRFPEIP